MEKWSLQPDPTEFDPRRHVLLIKGSMKDVSAILQKFGSMFGRPSPLSASEGYDYRLALHGPTSSALERKQSLW